ncbi:MAG: complex I subunit 1/NuoH family protein [Fimbriimonas sp.]
MLERLQNIDLTAAFLSWPVWVQALVRVLLVVIPILTLVPGIIWWERRLLSWMQDRIGPNRVGNITFSRTSKVIPAFLKGKKFRLFGLLQPIADGVKLFFKEDLTPSAVDRSIYFLAPAIALFPAFAIGGTMPWGPQWWLTPVADVNIGVLYMLAVSSLGVYGIVLGGYGANNKYSLMGGLRASAQLISYELAMGMSLAAIVLATGSLKMTAMVKAQEGGLWGFENVPIQNWNIFTPYGFIAGVIFLICMVAETNRAPFDLPEAENELIAGYHTEYSSMKFAVFFMGEYAAMMMFGGILATIFFGGYNLTPIRWDYLAETAPFMNGFFSFMHQANYWLAPVGWMLKVILVLTFYIWLRATLPRLRYDQLMNLGWKSLLPIATANFMIVALWILMTRLYGAIGGWGAVIGAAILASLIYRAVVNATKEGRQRLETRTVTMVDPAPRKVELVEGTTATL